MSKDLSIHSTDCKLEQLQNASLENTITGLTA